MTKFGRMVGLVAAICVTASAAGASSWHVRQSKDEFTDKVRCRIIHGSEFSHGFMSAALGAYDLNYFFIERFGSDVRVGITNDSKLPIQSDVQVRVDDRPLVNITAADTPIDTAPSYPAPQMPGISPEVRAQIETSMHVAMMMASPFRALSDGKARALIAEMAEARKARWRFVRINASSDEGVEIPINGLADALKKCGISASVKPAPVADKN